MHHFRKPTNLPPARSLNDLPSLSSPRKRLKEAGRSSTCDDPTVSTTRANLSNTNQEEEPTSLEGNLDPPTTYHSVQAGDGPGWLTQVPVNLFQALSTP